MVSILKYFYARVTTQYDGLEWSHPTTVGARTTQSAINKINKMDLTHDNGIEVQYDVSEFDLTEITKQEYTVLRKFYI